MMGKRELRSSQCSWTRLESPSHTSRLINSLEIVKCATILSPSEHDFTDIRKSTPVCSTVGELLSNQFLYAISLAGRNGDDSIFVTKEKIVMLLSPESFASFGLDGKKVDSKYLVMYELNSPGNRGKRLDWALKNTVLEKYDFIVFTDEHEAAKTRTRILDLLVPPLEPVEGTEDEDSFADWSNSVLEWIALAVLSPQLLALNNGGVDLSLCNFNQPGGGQRCPVSVTSTTNSGLTSGDIQSIWEILKQHEWAVMHVVGFENAPMAWNSDGPHCRGKEFGYTIMKQFDSISCFKFLAPAI